MVTDAGAPEHFVKRESCLSELFHKKPAPVLATASTGHSFKKYYIFFSLSKLSMLLSHLG